MCGINVILGQHPNAEKLAEQMMRATAHRGPDFSSFTQVSQKVYFAANRLKILDLTDSSNQPMWNKEEDAVLAWNGALYNYQDLRNNLLDLGYHFQTNSDSEVLLYWLRHFGEKGIGQLKGMFSIAFADLRQKTVLILRDPSGEKPLYFSQSDSNWLFSSEAKPLTLGKDKKIDVQQFVPYFFQRHSLPDRSLFYEVQQVLPGTGLIFDFEGKLLDRFSWKHPKQTSHSLSQNSFEELLKDAVLKNFHTERRVGTVLSGGADSSLIYALWYEETGEPTPTFTVSFDEKKKAKYSDPTYSKKLGRKYPSLAKEIFVDLNKVKQHWQAYISSLDQPIADSASYLTWITAKEASTDVQVLLSGAGADELFGGYNRHKAYAQYLKNPSIWLFLKKTGLEKVLPSGLQKMVNSIEESQVDTFIQMSALQHIPAEYLPLIRKWYPKGDSPLKNALEWDRSFYLINDILKIHDNACMAHGVEGRAPYLDFELITMSQTMSEEQHHQQLGKVWIKEALKKRGLGFIAKRKKLGFGLPLQEWSNDPEYINWVSPIIQKMESQWGSHFSEEMRILSKNPKRAKGRQYLQVWNLFVLASWLEQNSI